MNGAPVSFQTKEGLSYNELDKRSKLNGSTVLKYQLSVYERSRTKAVVARLIKVGPQFSGSTASKKQTFSRSVALLAT
jgi:hypothetical protein